MLLLQTKEEIWYYLCGAIFSTNSSDIIPPYLFVKEKKIYMTGVTVSWKGRNESTEYLRDIYRDLK